MLQKLWEDKDMSNKEKLKQVFSLVQDPEFRDALYEFADTLNEEEAEKTLKGMDSQKGFVGELKARADAIEATGQDPNKPKLN